MPFEIGANVGPYRILEQLGQGGMATVYKAYHAALDRYVALKVLHPAFLEDPNFQARFRREARVVAKLDHPNIVPIYDFAEHENRPYLVMKFIEGETLKARLSRGSLSLAEVVRIIEAVGAALAYAHTRGVLHRDVKPSNVLLARDGGIYLADFGLARIAQAGESTLTSDMIMGTPQYISPEQAMGKKDLDEGTDIYSFGVMLYELIVGQVPFTADTPFSIIHDHIYSPLPLPRSINPNVPEPVERVLLKALAKNRDDRFPDIPSMVKAFKEAWAEAGISTDSEQTFALESTEAITRAVTSSEAQTRAAPPPTAGTETPGTVTGQAKKRPRWMFIAAGIVVLLCCAFAFAAVRRGKNASPVFTATVTAPPVTARPFATRTPRPRPRTPTPEPLPEDVVDVLRAIDENPEDPFLRVKLAITLWQHEMYRQAYQALYDARDVAGDNMDFYIEAGDQLAEVEIWVGAAGMYVQAATLQPPGENLPVPLREAMHEAVYRAAAEPEMPDLIPFEAIGHVDEPLMLVAQARYAYFYISPEEGRGHLRNLKRLKPDFPESLLLEAEFNAKEGDYEDARYTLNILLADLQTPDWIRAEAEAMIRELP